MLKLPCMFEDGCLFYMLANFYREQSDLKGIFFELKCSYRIGTGVGSLCIYSFTPVITTFAGI